MREAIEIKKDFYENYVSPNGLALLGKGHIENANGILFLAIFYAVAKKIDLLSQNDLTHAFDTLKKIEIEPGLFKREPTNRELEAHDNYVGICFLSVIFDLYFARQVVEYGTKTGFMYDNKNPEKPDPRTMRQGGDIALYKIAAGYFPTVWETIWLFFGIISASFKGSPSTMNLTWLRIQTISYAFEKHKNVTFLSGSFVLLFIASLIFNLMIRKRYGGIQGSFAKYYSDDHPIRRLAKEINL